LVLGGGGGSAGNAWLIGVIAGLFDAGLDVTEADLIVGTSAGSHDEITAHVFDNGSATQANYHESAVTVTDESIIVHYC
jgi:hypothetical protein